MNHQEFSRQMDRLKKVYGAVKYPEERVELIYEALNRLSVEQFEAQVKRFIASSEKAPMLYDFENAFAGKMGELRQSAIDAKLKNAIPCASCNNTGHVTMYNKKTGNEFAFQCTCQRGELLQPSFPRQYSAMGDDYASHRAWSVGRFDRVSAQKLIS